MIINWSEDLQKKSNVFDSNFSCSAALLRGDVDSAVELLEEMFTQPESPNDSVAYVMKKVFEEKNDNAVDKCKKVVSVLCCVVLCVL